jgi:hypothetical protein
MIRKKIKFSPKLQSSSLDDIKRFVPKDALNTPVISSYNNLPTSYQNGGHVKQTWWEKKIGGPKMQLGGFKENQDYDIERALELGYGRDASGHMYSRDYETGRILKSKNHETYQQALDDDRKIGYYPAEYNGQTYTVPSIGSPRKGPFSAEENAKRPHGRMQELTEFQNGGSPKYQNGGLPKYQNGTQTRRDIRSNTERPETRAESEFYRLYSSGKGSGQGHEMKEQPGTGRLYPDISAEYPKVETEGDKHWNIAKFAYSPFFGKSDKGGHHYNTTDGNVPLEIPEGDKARRNFLLEDIYKYNLADEDLSKGQAWRASKKFIRQNVDPLINSDYDKFTDQGVQLGRVDEGKNWFQNVNEWNTNNSTEWDRAHNKSENFRGDRKEISERQVFRGLKDFNRNFRQQTRKDARKNARSEWDEWNAKQAQEIESAKDHQGQETPQNMTGTWWKKSMMQNGGLPKYQLAGTTTGNQIPNMIPEDFLQEAVQYGQDFPQTTPEQIVKNQKDAKQLIAENPSLAAPKPQDPGTIDYGPTNINSKSYVGNPIWSFAAPNMRGKQRADAEAYHRDIIGGELLGLGVERLASKAYSAGEKAYSAGKKVNSKVPKEQSYWDYIPEESQTKDFLAEVKGELKQGAENRLDIKEGNEWLQNWINHPATQKKGFG